MASFSCPTGSFLFFDFFNYGRMDNVTCVLDTIPDLTCFFSSIPFGEACHLQQSCSIEVENSALGGDPCGGTFKYLHVKYRCVSGEYENTKEPTWLSTPVAQYLWLIISITKSKHTHAQTHARWKLSDIKVTQSIGANEAFGAWLLLTIRLDLIMVQRPFQHLQWWSYITLG